MLPGLLPPKEYGAYTRISVSNPPSIIQIFQVPKRLSNHVPSFFARYINCETLVSNSTFETTGQYRPQRTWGTIRRTTCWHQGPSQ